MKDAHLATIDVPGILHLKLYLDERPVQPQRSRRALGDGRCLAGGPRSFERFGVRVGLRDDTGAEVEVLECGVRKTKAELEARLDVVLIIVL